jgi:hypothetical protein
VIPGEPGLATLLEWLWSLASTTNGCLEGQCLDHIDRMLAGTAALVAGTAAARAGARVEGEVRADYDARERARENPEPPATAPSDPSERAVWEFDRKQWQEREYKRLRREEFDRLYPAGPPIAAPPPELKPSDIYVNRL